MFSPSTKQSAQDTQDSVDDAVRNAKDTARKAGDDVQGQVYDKADGLADSASRLGRKMRGAVESAEEEIAEAGDTIINSIREKPLHSVGIAVAVGFVFGVLFRR